MKQKNGQAVIKSWWFLPVCVIIVIVALILINSFMTNRSGTSKEVSSASEEKTYTSTAKVYVSGGAQTNADAGTNIGELATNSRLVSTCIEILCSDTYLKDVASQYEKQKITGSEIKSRITMNSVNGTEIIEIKYGDISPERARDILQLILNNAHSEIDRIMPGCRVCIVEHASLPEVADVPSAIPEEKEN